MGALYKRIGFQIIYAAKAKSTSAIPVAYVIYGLLLLYFNYLDLRNNS